jgi:hypothetical protein
MFWRSASETNSRASIWRCMAAAVRGIRPPVLSEEQAQALQPYLGFRHIVRNIYTENLIPSRIGDLVRLLPDLWPGIRRHLMAFASGLDQ